MKTITPVEADVVRDFELKINGSVQINNHNLDSLCPIGEGKCFKIVLEQSDIDRIYLLFEPTFTDFTPNKNYRLFEVLDSAGESTRVKYWLEMKVDLSESPDWAPVFVSPNLEAGPLIAIDGNHRLTAHYLTHRSVKGIHAYLFVHPKVDEWTWFPPSAKYGY